MTLFALSASPLTAAIRTTARRIPARRLRRQIPGLTRRRTRPNPDPDPSAGSGMRISIGSAAFTAKFENNAAARAFKALLPMTATMNDLNHNEKYCDLPQNLPTAASAPGTIRAGDIMLYGARTLVLFYKSVPDFVTATPGLEAWTIPTDSRSALGAGNVRIAFEPLR